MNKMLSSVVKSLKYGVHYPNYVFGDARYLKVNAIDALGHLRPDIDNRLVVDEKISKHLLEEGDLLIAAKGSRHVAWAYKAEHGKCVASTSFYVLKMHQSEMLSRYMAILLNSPRMQADLKAMGSGATIKTLKKAGLLNLKIQTPSLKEQLKTIEVHDALDKLIALRQELLEKQIIMKNELSNSLTIKSIMT